jgi:hypothetical protein
MKTIKVSTATKRGRKKALSMEIELADGSKEVLHVDPESEGVLGLLSGEFLVAEDEKNGHEIAKLTTLMLKTVFTEDSYRRLRALLLDKKISADDLGRVTEHAIELVSDRPTESRSA